MAVKDPNIIQFTTGPKKFNVYDISEGQFRHISAEEFKSRGLDPKNVTLIDGNKIHLIRGEGDTNIFANVIVNGQTKKIHIQNPQTFNDIGFSWNKVEETKPDIQKPDAGLRKGGPYIKPQLIRFTTGNEVYNISGGKLEHVTAADFETKRFSWKDVEEIDPIQTGVKKNADSDDIFVTIAGKDILIPDMETFKKTGLPQNIFTGGETQKNIPQMFEEIRTRKLLGQIWDEKPELQALYNRPDFYSEGDSIDPKTTGTTMETWAMLHGWQEDPERLSAYSAQNMVRATYWNLFGEDPFDPKTSDPRALAQVQQILSGDITSSASLRARVKLDRKEKWDSLTEGEKIAIELDKNIPPEEVSLLDIPTFTEFLKNTLDREGIAKQTNEFYDYELKNYLEGKGITERRTIEDVEELTLGKLTDKEKETLKQGDITLQGLEEKLRKEGRFTGGLLAEEEERDLTTVQKQFRQVLRESIEGFGSRGLVFSSIREEEESRIRGELGPEGERRKAIKRTSDLEKKEAQKAAQRTLEDLRRDKKLKKEAIGKGTQQRQLEIEKETKAREAEQLEKFKKLKEGVLTKEEAGFSK